MNRNGNYLALAFLGIDVVAAVDAPKLPAVRLDQPHISRPVIAFKPQRPRFGWSNPVPALLPQDFDYTGDGFADVALEFLDCLALRVASRKSENLTPIAALRVFMDHNGEVPRVAIPRKSEAAVPFCRL